MKRLSLLLLILAAVTLLLTSVTCQKHNVAQILHKDKFLQTLNSRQFTLLYVYSSSCGFCKEFTPLFQKLSTQQFFSQKNVQFVKVDQQLFKEQLKQYGVYSFPTLLFFWKDYSDYPIRFNEERNQNTIKSFIEVSTKSNPVNVQNAAQTSPYERIQEKLVLYYGKQSSTLYKSMSLIGNRDKFIKWTLVPIKNQSQQKIVVGGKQLIGSNHTMNQIQTFIHKVFARVFKLEQEAWVRMFVKKEFGMVFINHENNKKLSKIFNELAKQYYDLVFMQLTQQNQQYKAALKTMGIPDEQNIFMVDRKAQALFQANITHTKQNLRDFIQKSLQYEWPVYRKTQKTQKSQKLTRHNYDQRMSTNQDVVLFLYRRQQKISKSLIDLFNHLRKKLADNENLLLLRCDVSSNQIQQFLGFSLQKTPKIAYFRNRMKDKPIHFYESKISEESVIQFIMENTTFDWKDEWGEL